MAARGVEMGIAAALGDKGEAYYEAFTDDPEEAAILARLNAAQQAALRRRPGGGPE